ncbi:outer membrane lipopolysaccharide assembly protein LptE/RlpB [Sinobacterium caligoides]|uniref:LPS-assembly lipoprotein LptE n=1 Tax=Sinobacterium caligoides TaxID=933926 RepID=A0A3N2DG05_9GAMM|nr:LPS assembly lipoprotein LptE [Sinobacterium caligoides]ROR98736.1 outer membrane lipopolysaccharide assembly protein LptE/RlpB [Sinobacterium caligoides]
MQNTSLRHLSPSRLLCLVTLFIGLVGCGFQLRGELNIAEPVKHLHLTGKTSNPFTSRVRQRFPLYDIHIAANTDPQAYELSFLEVEEDTRSLSYDALARTSEYELSIEVEFTLLDNQGNTLIPPRKLYGEKTYNSNPNNVIASDNEEELLWKDLRVQVANALLNQLATIDPNKLEQLKEAQAAAEAKQEELDRHAIPPTANPTNRPQ